MRVLISSIMFLGLVNTSFAENIWLEKIRILEVNLTTNASNLIEIRGDDSAGTGVNVGVLRKNPDAEQLAQALLQAYFAKAFVSLKIQPSTGQILQLKLSDQR